MLTLCKAITVFRLTLLKPNLFPMKMYIPRRNLDVVEETQFIGNSSSSEEETVVVIPKKPLTVALRRGSPPSRVHIWGHGRFYMDTANSVVSLARQMPTLIPERRRALQLEVLLPGGVSEAGSPGDVAVSPDGTKIAVAYPNLTYEGNKQGAVAIFSVDDRTGEWGSDSWFLGNGGDAMTVSTKKGTLVVGDAGRVRIFMEHDDGSWELTSTLTPPGTENPEEYGKYVQLLSRGAFVISQGQKLYRYHPTRRNTWVVLGEPVDLAGELLRPRVTDTRDLVTENLILNPRNLSQPPRTPSIITQNSVVAAYVSELGVEILYNTCQDVWESVQTLEMNDEVRGLSVTGELLYVSTDRALFCFRLGECNTYTLLEKNSQIGVGGDVYAVSGVVVIKTPEGVFILDRENQHKVPPNTGKNESPATKDTRTAGARGGPTPPRVPLSAAPGRTPKGGRPGTSPASRARNSRSSGR